jgi:hypothetical protein
MRTVCTALVRELPEPLQLSSVVESEPVTVPTSAAVVTPWAARPPTANGHAVTTRRSVVLREFKGPRFSLAPFVDQIGQVRAHLLDLGFD